VINDDELTKHVIKILNEMPGNKVLIDHFLDGGIETEVDALCDGEGFHIIGLMEHIEPAGIHSGDSMSVLPAFDLSPKVIKDMEDYAKKIALSLQVKGLINIQYAVKAKRCM
jgi:carbamoyl-phosphate synthase large subunit